MEGVDNTGMSFDYWAWAAAGLIFGLSVGFVIVGYFIKPAIHNWEGSQNLWKVIAASISFPVGGSVAAAFLDAPQFYFIGVGIGLFGGCYHEPILIASFTRESVLSVLRLNEALGASPTDKEERATTILAVLAPPRSSKKSKQEIGDALGAGLDSLANQTSKPAAGSTNGEK